MDGFEKVAFAECWLSPDWTVERIMVRFGMSQSIVYAVAEKLHLKGRRPKLDVHSGHFAPTCLKVRRCLMCGDEFSSSHIGERVCTACKTTSAWRSGDEFRLTIARRA